MRIFFRNGFTKGRKGENKETVPISRQTSPYAAPSLKKVIKGARGERM
jgi:hypothetical protein